MEEEHKVVVISQPMFFPWVGLFEQIRLADTYVHYGDVQFSKGSFVNRVQIKTAEGCNWLTVPLRNMKLGRRIEEVRVKQGVEWKQRHLAFLAQALRHTPFQNEALELVSGVYSAETDSLEDVAVASIRAVCAYFGLDRGVEFCHSRDLRVEGSGSQRVLDIVKTVGGTIYVTGHGAKNYLLHEKFDASGIKVEYMNYRKTPYHQLYGDFNPYVSVLDLIANMGRDGAALINSETIYWKDFT